MGQMTSKRKGSHRLSSSRRQTGVSLMPALITICVFATLTTQVIIPNQFRNLHEANINAVASSAETLIQASYAFRSANNVWPKGFVIDNTVIPPIAPNEILDSRYLPFFNNRTPWAGSWTINNTPFYFETNTGSETTAQALIQKIGSYAQIFNTTIVRVYPATPGTVAVEDLDVGRDITVNRNIILTGEIRAPDGTTVFDASSSPTTMNPNTNHYHSSKRFKKNIHPLDTPIESIYRLKPVSFDYKEPFTEYKTANAANQEIGLIAEQVLPLIPEITLVKDDKVMGIDYPKLSILLLKALQGLKKDVEVLQQNNQRLQKQIIGLNGDSLNRNSPNKVRTVVDLSEVSSAQ